MIVITKEDKEELKILRQAEDELNLGRKGLLFLVKMGNANVYAEQYDSATYWYRQALCRTAGREHLPVYKALQKLVFYNMEGAKIIRENREREISLLDWGELKVFFRGR